MTPPLILATYADGTLRVFTRSNGDGLRSRAVLDVEDASPELLATMAADMAAALGWLPAPRPPRREPAERAPARRKHRPRAELAAMRDALVATISERPGITTTELAEVHGLTSKDASNHLRVLIDNGSISGLIEHPNRGTPQAWRLA